MRKLKRKKISFVKTCCQINFNEIIDKSFGSSLKQKLHKVVSRHEGALLKVRYSALV